MIPLIVKEIAAIALANGHGWATTVATAQYERGVLDRRHDYWRWTHVTGTERLHLSTTFDAFDADCIPAVHIDVHRPATIVGGLDGSIVVIRGRAQTFRRLLEGWNGDHFATKTSWHDAVVCHWSSSPLAEPRHHEALRHYIEPAVLYTDDLVVSQTHCPDVTESQDKS